MTQAKAQWPLFGEIKEVTAFEFVDAVSSHASGITDDPQQK